MMRKLIIILLIVNILIIPNDCLSKELNQNDSLIGVKSIELIVRVNEIGNLTETQVMNDTKLNLMKNGIKIDNKSDYLLVIEIRTLSKDDIVRTNRK